MTLHMKTYILAALAALVLSAPRTAVAGSVQILGLNIDATTAGALSWGDDRDKLDAAITNEVDPVAIAALSGYATTGQLAIATANLEEQDPRAMRLYHYSDPDIVITPTNFFGFNPATGTITSYSSSGPIDVVIPYEINGVPVVAIGESAFESDQRVTKITSPRTLTSIGNYALYGSLVTTLTAPALTSIGDGAFQDSSLATLTAPALTSIGNYAFQDSSLATLTAPALTSIGNYALYGSLVTTLTAPALTSIGDGAFQDSSLATLTAPALTSIGDGAFSSSSLTTLTAPALTSIGDYAFYYCTALTSVYYGSDKPMVGAGIYDGTPANLVNYVTNPQATGWGATFGGRPVVRLPLYADAFHGSGAALTGVTKPVDIADRPTFAQVTNVVDAAIDALPATIYSDVSAAAAATAVIVSNTPIYTLSISSASVISNDTSALFFDGNAARWELWVDFAATAALGSTFAANMDFVGCEPELTVTGCYKFAVSTVDGITMQARQTYPTRYEWNDDAGVTMKSFTSETNASVNIIAYSYDQYTFCEVYVKGEATAIGKTYNILTKAHFNGDTVDFVIASGLISTSGDCITFANHSPASWWAQNIHANTRCYIIQKTGTDNTSTARIWARKRRMNELEIKAYSAGWRP